MPFNVCYYHMVWSIKQRARWLTPDIERLVYSSIDETSKGLLSPILAMNGSEDHIHVVVRIALKVSISEWVQRAKGKSGHDVNMAYSDLPQRFRWQESYGVLTFGVKQLEFVVGYVEGQKERHRLNQLEPYLERTEESSN